MIDWLIGMGVAFLGFFLFLFLVCGVGFTVLLFKAINQVTKKDK